MAAKSTRITGKRSGESSLAYMRLLISRTATHQGSVFIHSKEIARANGG
jgi:hypothetical protein